MDGFPKRITNKRKCGCEYISESDPIVRAGYELGGYLWKVCPTHTLKVGGEWRVSAEAHVGTGRTFKQALDDLNASIRPDPISR